MTTTLLHEYRVHHSSPDGVLVQLPGSGGGFGRLTRETLGGDLLAERLLKSFAARAQVPAILRRVRDSQGYRLLGVDLHEVWSELYTYPKPVQELLSRLFRKHLLVGLGTTTAARLVKASDKGLVFTIPPHLPAVAAWERLETGSTSPPPRSEHDAASQPCSDEEVDDEARRTAREERDVSAGQAAMLEQDGIEVRLLNYDPERHVVAVTARSEVVNRTPTDTAVLAAALRTLRPGASVEARVLLSTLEDPAESQTACAVVELVIASGTPPGVGVCSVLGYYLYRWPATPTPTTTTTVAPPPEVGATLRLRVEFVAEHTALQEALPFVILSHRDENQFAELPPVRLRHGNAATTTTTADREATASEETGLIGRLPWREDAAYDAHADLSDAEADSKDGRDDGPPRLRRRKLEEAMDAYERGMESAVPTSPEEFQRLLLASPNSSYLWTQYMAHHVSLQHYEEARQVAEKALATINPREQEERLNVWVAYLNIENLYGTAESLAAVFRRALQQQLNAMTLHERLADIYAASDKPNQLLALCRTMTSKFRSERRAWERLGVVLVSQGKRDQLKRMMKDMSSALKKDDAGLAVVHIAVHEYKHGSVENGRALLEGLLAKLPRKSDVWSAYVDQELALLRRRAAEASVQYVRTLFERAVTMNFTAKVMQQFLTRFLGFEREHGTAAEVEKVKERARAYVQAKIHAVTDTGVA